MALIAEWVTRTLSSNSTARQGNPRRVATPLTQQHRSEGRGGAYIQVQGRSPIPERICKTCGTTLKKGKTYCLSCRLPISKSILIEAAKLGRISTHSAEAEALRAATQRRQIAARKTWRLADHPNWLTDEFYLQHIQPRLAALTNSAVASKLLVSKPYAAEIRMGRRRPHRRHGKRSRNWRVSQRRSAFGSSTRFCSHLTLTSTGCYP